MTETPTPPQKTSPRFEKMKARKKEILLKAFNSTDAETVIVRVSDIKLFLSNDVVKKLAKWCVTEEQSPSINVKSRSVIQRESLTTIGSYAEFNREALLEAMS